MKALSHSYYTTNQPLKFPRNSAALNYLGASDKAINLSIFPILMRIFWNWPNEFHRIASPCFQAVSFVSKFIGHFPISYKFANKRNCLKTRWRNSIKFVRPVSESSIAEYIIVMHCIHCFILKPNLLSFTCSYSLSFVFICCTTRFHPLSFVVILCINRCHSLSFVGPLVVICFNSLSLVVLLVVTQCIIVCLFINDPLHSQLIK